MAYDFQSEMDRVFFSSSGVFSELVTATPYGGSSKSIYIDIEKVGPEIAKSRGGKEQAIGQTIIRVSKTDWPTVTKNGDKFTLTINGSSRVTRVIELLAEDPISYTLAVA